MFFLSCSSENGASCSGLVSGNEESSFYLGRGKPQESMVRPAVGSSLQKEAQQDVSECAFELG